MKLLIDDARISEIKRLIEEYSIDEVTTNPSILAKADRRTCRLFKWFCYLFFFGYCQLQKNQFDRL